MVKRIARFMLKWAVRELYSSDKSRDEFARMVNNETWLGSQIGSGGQSLMKSKPICREEVISIMCVLADNRSYCGDDSKTVEVDYYESEWKN